MKTNTAIIGLVLAVSLIACGTLIYYGMQDDTITIEVDVKGTISSGYSEGKPSVGGLINFTYTSSTEERFTAGYPDIVFEKDGETMRFSSPYIIEWISGKTIPVRMYYETGELVNIDEWDYHFELSRSMKIDGGYKLIEVNE